MFQYLLTILMIPLLIHFGNWDQEEDLFVKLFNKIPEQPKEISFTNLFEINNNGGHLQGIQLIKKGEDIFVVATGSSDVYSYYVVTKLGEKNEVISVNQLMQKPYKHAGGFQIFEDYMAIGIEDNSAKDKSKVCIFSISDPQNPSVIPIAQIERNGQPLRSTAGCVGITRHRDKYIVAVGDWDTKHIDFYICENEKIEKGNFKKVYTMETAKLSKQGWIDKSWTTYQNINLFSTNTHLYMIGTGQNSKQQNCADLYQLNWDLPESVQMKKVASKTFSTTQKNNFKAGAGFYFDNHTLKGISCGYNVEETSFFNIYTN
ncbi:hypothetical protein OU798_22810 [Prolixibacteraceae bacterium Z1-6]|uniref:Uncharacterized protein n=1 Tax=Draconibacterium aestuarii TaxID=2998507 RepID=A0A9X3F9U0_9BACT|nr:hypothetical protein [Prolixibacteraceae bacterium Z1-6]